MKLLMERLGISRYLVSGAIYPYLVAVLLVVPVIAVYGQVGNHSFITFDDDQYVYDNPHVLEGLTHESISWAFSTFHASNWHPLTWLSHMLDVEFFGTSPGWHHRINVLFHLLNTELLFLVLWRMTGGLWQSAFVAALFGVHPLHVESVAWVAERKDVLSSLFWLLTMGAYLRYVRSPSISRFLLVVFPFAAGILSKPMLVTLPIVLLLLDFWPLGRLNPPNSSDFRVGRFPGHALSRLVLEKIPLLGLSAISCIVTYAAQAGNMPVSGVDRLGMRMGNAVVSYVLYLGKTLWPLALAVVYPHPATIGAVIPAWKIALTVLLLFGLSLLSLRQISTRPYFFAGWFWYLGTLVPVIGLVQVGDQAMADRYTYVPLIGIFIMVAWGIPQILVGWRFRKIALEVVGVASIAALSVTAWMQTGYWRDSVTLFSHAVAVTEKNWVALDSLGVAFDSLGEPQQAVRSFHESIRIKPDSARTWYNLGLAYDNYRQPQQAIESYREALRLWPKYVEAWDNLGAVYLSLGQLRQAMESYWEALRIWPEDGLAWTNLGIIHDRLGDPRQAVVFYLEALRFWPKYVSAWHNLGVAYEKLGQNQKADDCYREAQRLRTLSPRRPAQQNLGTSNGEDDQNHTPMAGIRGRPPAARILTADGI